MSSCGVCPEQIPTPTPPHPPLGHHWKNGSPIALCYYSSLDHNVSLPVMRADSIAQIAKALARLVLVVSPPFVTVYFIVEWSKTVNSQNTLWRQHQSPTVWCDCLAFYHKAVESQDVKRLFVLTVLLSSAVLQVWWTVCSSGLGDLIRIHSFHYSHHSVEVTMRISILLVLSVTQLIIVLLMFAIFNKKQKPSVLWFSVLLVTMLMHDWNKK